MSAKRCTGVEGHEGLHGWSAAVADLWIATVEARIRREMDGDYHDDGIHRCTFAADGRSPLDNHPRGDGSGTWEPGRATKGTP
jgi:hypothetical protein